MKQTENSILQSSDLAFRNIEQHPEIRARFARRFGLEELARGRALLGSAQELHKDARNKQLVLAGAHETFTEKRQALDRQYKMHRKLSRVCFRDQRIPMLWLKLNGQCPRNYGPWIHMVKTYYETLAADHDLLAELERFSINREVVLECRRMAGDVVDAYSHYMHLKGASQNLTQLKDEAFRRLTAWMSDFYEVARIIFDDQPKQLVALGIKVRNKRRKTADQPATAARRLVTEEWRLSTEEPATHSETVAADEHQPATGDRRLATEDRRPATGGCRPETVRPATGILATEDLRPSTGILETDRLPTEDRRLPTDVRRLPTDLRRRKTLRLQRLFREKLHYFPSNRSRLPAADRTPFNAHHRRDVA